MERKNFLYVHGQCWLVRFHVHFCGAGCFHRRVQVVGCCKWFLLLMEKTLCHLGCTNPSVHVQK